MDILPGSEAMLRLNLKKSNYKNGEIPLEKETGKVKFKRLDKIYITAAIILALGWGIWNLGGLSSIKLPKIKFYFISDFFAERASQKSSEFICWDAQNFAVTGEYILYFDPNMNVLFRMNRDGSGNTKIFDGAVNSFSVKDDWIYFATPDGGGGIFKVKLDGSHKTEVLKSSSVNLVKIIGDYIYFNWNGTALSRVTLKGKDRVNFRNSTQGDTFPYGNYVYRVKQGSWEVFKTRVGETEGKLAFNFGKEVLRVSLYKDYFYYVVPSGILYRRSLDGSNEVEVAKGLGNYFIDNGTLYYSKYENIANDPASGVEVRVSSKLYKANLDGSGSAEVLSTDKFINSLGNGIIGCYGITGELSFINLEGNKEIAIPDLEYEILAGDIKDCIGDTVVKGFENNYGDFKFFSSKDDIYYSNYIIGGINKYSKTDKKSTRINQGQAYGFEMLGNLIFYRSVQNGNLYCMNSDGSNPRKVFNYNVNLFFPTQEALYFTSTNSKLYKVQLEDNKIIKLSEDYVGRFVVKDGYIYYSSYLPGSLYRIKLDGSSREKITLPYFSTFSVVGDYIYFYNEISARGEPVLSLKRKRFEQDKIETVIETANFSYTISENHIYYIEMLEAGSDNTGNETKPRVIMCDLNGKNKKILNLPNLQFMVDGEKVYIQNNQGGLEEKNLRDIIIK